MAADYIGLSKALMGPYREIDMISDGKHRFDIYLHRYIVDAVKQVKDELTKNDAVAIRLLLAMYREYIIDINKRSIIFKQSADDENGISVNLTGHCVISMTPGDNPCPVFIFKFVIDSSMSPRHIDIDCISLVSEALRIEFKNIIFDVVGGMFHFQMILGPNILIQDVGIAAQILKVC